MQSRLQPSSELLGYYRFSLRETEVVKMCKLHRHLRAMTARARLENLFPILVFSGNPFATAELSISAALVSQRAMHDFFNRLVCWEFLAFLSVFDHAERLALRWQACLAPSLLTCETAVCDGSAAAWPKKL